MDASQDAKPRFEKAGYENNRSEMSRAINLFIQLVKGWRDSVKYHCL